MLHAVGDGKKGEQEEMGRRESRWRWEEGRAGGDGKKGEQEEMGRRESRRRWEEGRAGGDGKKEGRVEAENRAFREELERKVGLVEARVMMCIAGEFNGHVGTAETGEEESVGGFGRGTRNREGRELVELVKRDGLAVAGTFLLKWPA